MACEKITTIVPTSRRRSSNFINFSGFKSAVNKKRYFSSLVITAICLMNAGATYADEPPMGAPKSASGAADTQPEPAPREALPIAKLVIKSTGMPAGVEYSLSFAEQDCEGFDRLGAVFHSGREVLLPWIAKMTEKAQKKFNQQDTKLEKLVRVGEPIQIKGYSQWTDSNAFMTSTKSCGPLVSKFTPEGTKTYLVEFSFENSSCVQRVFDITNPPEQKAVVVQNLEMCKK
jgi:hypothetical protein